MVEQQIDTREETLDPQDWDAMRALGHQMVDDMMAYLRTVGERPAWQSMPASTRAFFDGPAPLEPEAPETIYRDFVQHIQPYPLGNIHPRFWGWVLGTGTPLGALADMLAAMMNSNGAGGDHAAIAVEKQVLNWLKEIVGFPAQASGVLVGGASVANLVGLIVARNNAAGYDARKQGVTGAGGRLIVYASAEAHFSCQRAVEITGLGTDSFHQIPANSHYEIDIEKLKAAIAADRAAGHRPLCVIGCVGTVGTGAIDDLSGLAEVCEKEGVWFHVDGAFGAIAMLSEELRPRLKGMERADSLAFDLHKWMYVPYDVACVLVRRPQQHVSSFSASGSYVTHYERGIAVGDTWFQDYGVQQSRSFRALKVWFSLREHGIKKYGRLIQQNVDQARYLTRLVEESSELELLAETALNIVCFRYIKSGLDENTLNHLNQNILFELQEKGIAAPSYVMLGEKFAIRAAITNHRSRREDFDLLVREVIRIGGELSG